MQALHVFFLLRGTGMCPREESNLDRLVRSEQLYPLSYEGANLVPLLPRNGRFINSVILFYHAHQTGNAGEGRTESFPGN